MTALRSVMHTASFENNEWRLNFCKTAYGNETGVTTDVVKTGTAGGQRNPEPVQFDVSTTSRGASCWWYCFRPSSLLSNLEPIIIAPNVFKTMHHPVP